MELKLDLKLNKPQKVIILMVLIVALSIAAFYFFVYSSARSKMRQLNAQLNTLRFEVERIEAAAGGKTNLDKAYSDFHKRLQDLEARIPREERTALSALSSEAAKIGIEVLAIKPGKIKKSDITIRIDGRPIMAMPISMDMSCDYITLGRYLAILREELPTLITVDSIYMVRPRTEEFKLDVKLKLILYQVSE